MIKIFYHLQTTGTDYKKHSIIQLSGLIEKDGVIVDQFDYNIKPHPKALVEAEALRVNNKSLADIYDYPDMCTVLGQFKMELRNYVDRFDKTDKATLIGFYNASFGDAFLRTWFELCEDAFFGSFFWFNSIDVSCLASQYLINRRSKMPSFKLIRVAKELGLEVDEDKRTALYDAQLIRQIYNIVTGIELEL